MSVLAFGILIVTESYPVLIVILAILGAGSTVRSTVMSIYIYENMSKSNYANIMTFDGMAGGLIAVGTSLYFTYGSKSAHWLLLGCFMVQVVGGIMSLHMYESPKFLIESG